MLLQKLALPHKVLAAKHKTVTQILFAYNLILGKFFGRTLKQDFSFKQQISTVGDAQGFLHIVVGYQNTDIPVFQLPDNLLNIFHRNRVYSAMTALPDWQKVINGILSRLFLWDGESLMKNLWRVRLTG